MSEIYIKPVGYRVLVKADPVQEMSEGGIIIAGYDKKLERAGQMTGTLVAIGHLAWTQFQNETPWAKVGDRVMYARYSGKIVEDHVTKEDYVILNDEDITSVLLEEDK